MSFLSMPLNMIPIIACFAPNPISNITSKEIKEHVRQLANMILINHTCKRVLHEKIAIKIEQLRQLDLLLNKYSKYNALYETAPPGSPNPHLADALFTGYEVEHIPRSFNVFTQQIDDDIRKMIKLTPQSMACMIGQLSPEINISPLGAACINKNIPLGIIKFILRQGADSEVLMIINGNPINLDGLKGRAVIINQRRLKTIRLIFKEFQKSKKGSLN